MVSIKQKKEPTDRHQGGVPDITILPLNSKAPRR
jgi:hypothetical protein